MDDLILSKLDKLMEKFTFVILVSLLKAPSEVKSWQKIVFLIFNENVNFNENFAWLVIWLEHKVCLNKKETCLLYSEVYRNIFINNNNKKNSILKIKNVCNYSKRMISKFC